MIKKIAERSRIMDNGDKVRIIEWKVVLGQRTLSFTTPLVFAGYSMWGNQWLKLLLFSKDWYNRINLMLSLFDILMSTKERREKCLTLGIRNFMTWQTESYFKKIRDYLVKRFPAYRDYLNYSRCKIREFAQMKGLVMLDSGGFSLDSKSNVRMFSNLGYSFKKPTQIQRELLKLQLLMKTDIALTLDRVIRRPNEISFKEKKERIRFNLECAKAALEMKAEILDKEGKIDSLIFAVVHPYGPSFNKLNETVIKKYKQNCIEYVSELLDFENELGVQFDGFAVGSLIPLPVHLVQAIGECISNKIHEERGKNVLLHGLGMTNSKMRELLKVGFHTFDTNFHVKLARNKFYLLNGNKKVKIDNLKVLKCNCHVCRNHDLAEFTERRKGVAEVSTVLLSLHNFFMYQKQLIAR